MMYRREHVTIYHLTLTTPPRPVESGRRSEVMHDDKETQ